MLRHHNGQMLENWRSFRRWKSTSDCLIGSFSPFVFVENFLGTIWIKTPYQIDMNLKWAAQSLDYLLKCANLKTSLHAAKHLFMQPSIWKCSCFIPQLAGDTYGSVGTRTRFRRRYRQRRRWLMVLWSHDWIPKHQGSIIFLELFAKNSCIIIKTSIWRSKEVLDWT